MVKIASLVNIIILLRALEKKNVPDFFPLKHNLFFPSFHSRTCKNNLTETIGCVFDQVMILSNNINEF